MRRDVSLILGVPIDKVNMEEATNKIFSLVEDYEKDGNPRFVATVNVNILTECHSWNPKSPKNPELINALRRADMNTPDGMPLVWLSKLLGDGLKERVTGADLVPRIAQKASRLGKRIFFLGGEQASAFSAASILEKQNPGLKIAGILCPTITLEKNKRIGLRDNDREIINTINRSQCDILLIALGGLKQEIWFSRVRRFLNIPVSIGVGGTFNFISGTVSRAPAWMQRMSLEWVYRLIQEPRRLWKRYFLDGFKFIYLAVPSIFFKTLESWVGRISLKVKYKNNSGREIIPKILYRSKMKNVTRIIKDCHKKNQIPALEVGHFRSDQLIKFVKVLLVRQNVFPKKPQFRVSGIGLRMKAFLISQRCWDLIEPNSMGENES